MPTKLSTFTRTTQTKYFLDEGPRKVYGQMQTTISGVQFQEMVEELQRYKTLAETNSSNYKILITSTYRFQPTKQDIKKEITRKRQI